MQIDFLALATYVLVFVSGFLIERCLRHVPVKKRDLEPLSVVPPRDYSTYVCPVCGGKGFTFMECERPDCVDGR